MATKAKVNTDAVLQEFLASEKKITDLTRSELADLLDQLADDHWLRPIVLTELQTRIS